MTRPWYRVRSRRTGSGAVGTILDRLPALRKVLEERFQYYNQERRHSSIGDVPPREHLNNVLFTRESEPRIKAAS